MKNVTALAALVVSLTGFVSMPAWGQVDLPPPFSGQVLPLNGKLNSPFGPRNPESAGATRVHMGVDYNLASKDSDFGVLIPSFTGGTITDIVISPSGAATGLGHSLAIALDGQTKDVIKLSHLFDKDQVASGVFKMNGKGALESAPSFKLVLKKLQGKLVVPGLPTRLADCPYLLFLNTGETTVQYAYTKASCPHLFDFLGPWDVKYASLPVKNPVARVDSSKFAWLAAIGRSGLASQTGAHLHVSMNDQRDNPLLRIKHLEAPLPYQVTLGKAGKYGVGDTQVMVRVEYSPWLDLDKVKIELPPELGGGTETWSFGGKRQENGTVNPANASEVVIVQPIGGCEATFNSKAENPLARICAEPYKAEPNVDAVTNPVTGVQSKQKILAFQQPVVPSSQGVCGKPIRVSVSSITRDYAAQILTLKGSPPVAVNDTASTRAGMPVVINVKANDSDPDTPKEQLLVKDIAVVGGADKGSALVNADGTITFTPKSGVTGPVVINYQLTTPCGDVSNLASVTVTVTEDVDLNDFRFDFRDASYTATPTCPHYLGRSPVAWSSLYADFDNCQQYVQPVVRCIGKGCLNNRFAVATTGYSQRYYGQAILVPAWTGGPIPSANLGGICFWSPDELIKTYHTDTYSQETGKGWYPVSTSDSAIYPSGTYNSYLSGFAYGYHRNITNLVFTPQYTIQNPMELCAPAGYAWTIYGKTYDRILGVYKDFSFSLALP